MDFYQSKTISEEGPDDDEDAEQTYSPTTTFDTIREHIQVFMYSILSIFVSVEYFQRQDWYDDLKSKARWIFDYGSIRITVRVYPAPIPYT